MAEGARPGQARAEVEQSIEEAWRAYRAEFADRTDEAIARSLIVDPSKHAWRLVDAALDRLQCPDCGERLGSGPRGCASCDSADGFRFAAREVDRAGVPRGNEHAIRVSTAVLRSAVRYPEWSVRANELYLPLFLRGEMPTRADQEAMLAAWRGGAAVDAEGVETFGELAARARASLLALRYPTSSAKR